MRRFWLILRQAGTDFITDHGMKLSASLSYYTIFSLGPVMIIVISLAGIFFGREAVEGKIYFQLNGLLGPRAAAQIQDIIRNIEASQLDTTGAVVGLIILLVGATGVFTEIQDSINFIWSLRSKPKKSWLKFLLNRMISFSLIISFGFLLMVSLAIHALVDLMYEKLANFFDEATVYVFFVVNYATLFCIIAALFTIIFKVLPDASIRWRDALVGSCFTSFLFLVGKFGIGYYLGASDFGATYGAAASIVIILVWVYFSSIILYFGAEFTKVYTLNAGAGIVPDKTAVFIIKQEVAELHLSGSQEREARRKQENGDRTDKK